MRSAAKMLGMIGGIIGIFVGLFGYGYVAATEAAPEVGEALNLFENPAFTQAASFLAPLLAIGGAAMATSRALWGGIAMLVGAALFYFGFGFNVATMFPIGFVGVAGVLAIAAGKPDEEKAHF